MSNIDQELGRYVFLDGFSQRHIELLNELATPVELSAGEMFYRDGDPANRLYLIQEGEVALELDSGNYSPILVQTIGPGETIGWPWTVQPYFARVSGRTLTPVKAIFFCGNRLLEHCDGDPELGYQLIKRVMETAAKRLQAAMGQLIIFRSK